MIKYIGNEALDPRLTLIDSAQCFCWRETPRGFSAAPGGVKLRIWRDANGIWAESEHTVEYIRNYLDLDRDYAAVAAEYAHIPAARRAIELYPGMRVLNQDPWETLISFILSANNNVTRIRSLVQGICAEVGCACCSEDLFCFPRPEKLAGCTEEQLRGIGVGYRAPYLIGTAKRVCEGFPIHGLREMDYETAHAQLVTLPGVGDKVADCVLLFGCGHGCAFPVDVWVEKLLGSWFGLTGSRTKLAKEARSLLGVNAGLLQQFLFHAARMGDIEL